MCNDSNKKSFPRRKFLGSALTVGAGSFLLDPFRAVTEGIVDGFIQKAHAEATNTVAGRNYINLHMEGAPIRYQFDQWLRIHASDPALAKVTSTGKINDMICDSFTWNSANQVTPTQTPFTYKGLLLPHLWSQTVYNSAGTARPLTDLLNHMMVVRGFGTGLDGHQFNMMSQLAPIGGVSTISGLAAENSAKTFDSVQWPDRASYAIYYSSIGKSQSRLSGTTPLNTLMEGFGSPTYMNARTLKNANADAIELARARLAAYSRSENSGAKLVSQSLENAAAMMKKGVADIASYWAPAVARYKAAINKSMQTINIPGISNKPLVSDESVHWNIGSGDIITISKDVDARTILTSATTIQNLAESLALAEYLIKSNLSSSIEIRADAFQGLDAKAKTALTGTTPANVKTLALDMHATGSNTVILLLNAYYRGLAAGLLEFIDQIGADTWANTVVHVQGDFGRSARSAGSGSDHGYNQMVTSAFSGAFTNGPVVVGNIKLQGTSTTYDGTQGLAAPIDGYVQKGAPTPTMAASNIAALLNVNHNPYQNTASPLVSLSGNTLTALATPKIVA